VNRSLISQPAPSDRTPSRPSWVQAALCMFVFVVIVSVFYPVTGDKFINYDDNDYVTHNPHVQGGLTWPQLLWAFRNTDTGNWHPLTWISHMVDCQIYGSNAWGHHLTSVLIHAANAVLLLLVLNSLTGLLWRSVVAALLFGLHPLRVESVAWIAERKDVLSALFWLLALWAYAGYARNQSNQPGRAAVNYWIALLAFALGLMSKPMVITLPLALLLIDYWPLGRMTRDNAIRLLTEKVPFFVLAAIGTVIAFVAQKSQGAVIEYLTPGHRLATAILAYSRYLGKYLWPVNLAILYPHPAGGWPAVEVISAAALFLGLSAIAIRTRLTRPWFAVGWFWYIVTLLPVVGLVQIGSQSLADRYSYIPGIGLVIILVWGISELTTSLPARLALLAACATGAVVVCAALTEHQIGYWKDSGTVFRHAIDVTGNSYVARKVLGDFYSSQNRPGEAVALYREAIEMCPHYEGARLNLGAVLSQTGETTNAIAEFKESIHLAPKDASAYNDLGAVLGAGHLDESIALFKQAAELDPNYYDAHDNLARALVSQGRLEEAIAQFEITANLRPGVQTHFQLALALEKAGRTNEAIDQLNEALRQRPDFTPAQQALERLQKQPGK
jgi:protein O-mannosyl-transferase